MPSGVYTKSEAHKRKLSRALIGNTPHNKGKAMSAEQKVKVSEGVKRAWKRGDFNENHKYPDWNGKHHTEITKRKISETLTGVPLTEERRLKIVERLIGHTYTGKGIAKEVDRKVYYSAHYWIKTNYGKANSCDNCHTEDSKLYDWSNISQTYKKNRDDWQQLCRKCHINFDMKIRLERMK